MKPIAVLISDVHYSVQTLERADKAINLALKHATKLQLPLVIAGDLHDTKANLRGECINRLISTLTPYTCEVYILVGNHDKINEKSDEHSLNFLKPYAHVIDTPQYIEPIDSYCIPYQYDLMEFRHIINDIPTNSRIIMHQGLVSALPGEYTFDKTAILKDWVKDYRVISGHYHARQDIKIGDNLFSYIGNPFTTSFGEAKDPEKGYQILYEDGSLEFVSTNLGRHIKYEFDWKNIQNITVSKDDYVWLKLHISNAELLKLNKEKICNQLNLIPAQTRIEFSTNDEICEYKTNTLNTNELIDELIEQQDWTPAKKSNIKEVWRDLADENS